MTSQKFEFDVRGKRIIVYAQNELVALQMANKAGRKMGLGDLVEKAAKPIANALGMGSCAGCEQRKDTLNELMPDIASPFRRDTL